MLRSRSSSMDHASSASSWQEECGGVDAKRRRVGGFGYGFKVSCVVGSCGFLACIRCGFSIPFAKILTNYLDNYYLGPLVVIIY
jgi:hypothetical protein